MAENKRQNKTLQKPPTEMKCKLKKDAKEIAFPGMTVPSKHDLQHNHQQKWSQKPMARHVLESTGS